ncbi:MAG TPA: prolyl oligopeptidase family serine peptidase [Bryobacteraceae bacterium]|nr:prolyl oligopeptidase family serine peptidase [Bryobacteraceae bacterium]
MRLRRPARLWAAGWLWGAALWGQAAGIPATVRQTLPGTRPFTLAADWQEQQRAQIAGYFQKLIDASPGERERAWTGASIEQHREHLRRLLGVRTHAPGEARVRDLDPEVAEVVLEIEPGFTARGLLFRPVGGARGPAVIAVPPEDQTAEAFAGVAPGTAPAAWLTSLLGKGTAVLVPGMVERTLDYPLGKKLRGKDRRHLLYRLGFIVGRPLVGLDVEQVLALRAFLAAQAGIDGARIGIFGRGQGGMTALYAAALEEQFAWAAVEDYFGPREGCWREPVDRTLYGQLREFGDAEVAALIAPRPLTVIGGGEAAQQEVARSRRAYHANIRVAETFGGAAPAAPAAIAYRASSEAVEEARNRHFEGLLEYLRRLDRESDHERAEHWKLESTAPGERAGKAEALRRELAGLMGVPEARAPLDPRTRLIRVTDKFLAYDVMLGVLDGVEAYGQLLVPRIPGRHLPAVVCQHGLGGQPSDITGLNEKPTVYHAFGGKLAEAGYVVFTPYVTVPVPQAELINPLVRQAASLGRMRTGVEVAKLRRIVDFLQSLPFVDGERIGYYGLSYGGYSAIWMGSMEPRLKTVIVSGHFNDWRSKITNEDLTTSYLFHPDEDFYNWDVLRRFTHRELIAAMWPRPVMVEFADRDGTTTPEWHERAWQQVIAWAGAWEMGNKIARYRFHGVHEIGGTGTFAFLDRWLRPERASRLEYSYLLWPSQRELPGLGDNAENTWPFVRQLLDAREETRVRGRFRVSSTAPVFAGMALRISRAGNPGDLVLRFGSREGAADLGEARIPARVVQPLYDLWYEARLPERRLDADRWYFVELRAAAGETPADAYVLYGPRPLGGTAWEHEFGFAYRVLDGGAARSRGEETHEFTRRYLEGEPGGPPVAVAQASPARPGEVRITPEWGVVVTAAGDEVVETAAADLREFFARALRMKLAGGRGPRILLEVSGGVDGVASAEGFEARVSADGIRIRAGAGRGVMRGVYWLEDAIRQRQAPYLAAGTTVRNARFARRITTSILPGGERYTETSRPMIYTDGLLQRISRDGFNGIWVWLNTEEAAMGSRVFPELDDPEAPARLARLEDVARRARRYGIDVWVYLATGYNHHVPPWFYDKHPEAKGHGWGNPMCTSDERVRRYHREIVENLFRRAPDLHGLVVIYDSEGFFYCGNSERNRAACERCRKYPSEVLARQVLTNLDDAMHAAGGPSKELIAWDYGTDYGWIRKLIPTLPKDILVQVDFTKGGLVVRDGVRHYTGDYNLTLVGPPDHFVEQYRDARAAGLPFMVKTEHAVSQEFIFVPYIPAMEQWFRRIARIREFDAAGWFGNWDHYGYAASLPARLINRMSFDPAPGKEQLLEDLARESYGGRAAPLVVRAWNHFSEGIRLFPYSDRVSRLPGPLQKGPSQPFFLDPKVKSFGAWRAWQNDLQWTAPWGPVIARKYLALVKDQFSAGIAELEAARRGAPEPYREAIAGEWRIARTIESSLQTVIHLIDWLTARDEYFAATSAEGRAQAAAKLERIALAERRNAQEILPVLESDSRLGYASEGGGVIRGGLFTPELVRWKLGQLDDVLARQLPALTGRPPAQVP